MIVRLINVRDHVFKGNKKQQMIQMFILYMCNLFCCLPEYLSKLLIMIFLYIITFSPRENIFSKFSLGEKTHPRNGVRFIRGTFSHGYVFSSIPGYLYNRHVISLFVGQWVASINYIVNTCFRDGTHSKYRHCLRGILSCRSQFSRCA